MIVKRLTRPPRGKRTGPPGPARAEPVRRRPSNSVLPIPFSEFLKETLERPQIVIRNIFQLFHDMVKAYMGEGVDEYPDDPESIHFVHYDCATSSSRTWITRSSPTGCSPTGWSTWSNPSSAGRSRTRSTSSEGPRAAARAPFLNNLLHKFETYAHTEPGMRYEVVWRFDRRKFGPRTLTDAHPLVDRLSHLLETRRTRAQLRSGAAAPSTTRTALPEGNSHVLEIPCPSHDNPLLLIPKEMRRTFYGELFAEHPFQQQLFTEKEYEWVFQDSPCTICSSLYDALLYQLKTPEKVLETLFARMYRFNRRLGEGISVFNPGDKPRGTAGVLPPGHPEADQPPAGRTTIRSSTWSRSTRAPTTAFTP